MSPHSQADSANPNTVMRYHFSQSHWGKPKHLVIPLRALEPCGEPVSFSAWPAVVDLVPWKTSNRWCEGLPQAETSDVWAEKSSNSLRKGNLPSEVTRKASYRRVDTRLMGLHLNVFTVSSVVRGNELKLVLWFSSKKPLGSGWMISYDFIEFIWFDRISLHCSAYSNSYSINSRDVCFMFPLPADPSESPRRCMGRFHVDSSEVRFTHAAHVVLRHVALVESAS